MAQRLYLRSFEFVAVELEAHLPMSDLNLNQTYCLVAEGLEEDPLLRSVAMAVPAAELKGMAILALLNCLVPIQKNQLLEEEVDLHFQDQKLHSEVVMAALASMVEEDRNFGPVRTSQV